MKRALVFLGICIFFSAAADASGGRVMRPTAEDACAEKTEDFHLLPELQKKEQSAASDVETVPRPTGKGQNRLRLEANDDLAALSFQSGVIAPYVGASIDLLPLPNYDPETTTSQVLAYGVGAGFGCDLGDSTRLSLRYQIRFFQDNDSLLGSELEDLGKEEETHRISLGLQKTF